MRQNPAFDAGIAIAELRTGEALVSFLDAKGIPGVTERALIYPPRSRLTPLTGPERDAVIRSSPVAGKYETMVDRISAYELLAERAEKAIPAEEKKPEARAKTTTPQRKKSTSVLSSMAGSAARSAGTQIGREIIRGILGSLAKK
jgi:DNA helicase HerA-like ATPase